MNIKELAEQAGANFEHIQWVERDLAPLFERFAELVVANIDPKSFMTWQEGYEVGVAHEREECAKVFESVQTDSTVPPVHFSLSDTAKIIRARSKA
jgi:hypothetical protein